MLLCTIFGVFCFAQFSWLLAQAYIWVTTGEYRGRFGDRQGGGTEKPIPKAGVPSTNSFQVNQLSGKKKRIGIYTGSHAYESAHLQRYIPAL